KMIYFYNSELERFRSYCSGNSKKHREDMIGDFVDTDTRKISWSSSLIAKVVALQKGVFDPSKTTCSLYRPFTKQWVYFDGMFNHRVYQMPKLFPDGEAWNRVISVTGVGSKNFSAVMSDVVPDLQVQFNGQSFPLNIYEDEIAAIAASSEQRAASSEQRAASSEQRAASSEQRAASSEQRAASSEQRAASSECTDWQPEGGRSTEESCDLSDAERNQGVLGIDDGRSARSAHDRRCAVLSDVSVRNGGGPVMSDADQSDLFQSGKSEERKLVRR